MEFWIKYILVVLSVLVADICWTFYFMKAAERKSIAASVWSTLIILCGAFSVDSYVTDSRFISAAAIGAFIGTYIAVEYKEFIEGLIKKKKGKRK